MSTAAYPAAYEKLLKKAGLLGSGRIVVIRAYEPDRILQVSKANEKILREKIVRHDITTPFTTAVVLRNKRILGDWTVGLTKEEVEIIEKYCKVDRPETTTQIRLYDEMKLDTSVPADMSIFRLLEPNNCIGLTRLDAERHGRKWYFSVEEEKNIERTEKINFKKKVYKLMQSITPDDKVTFAKLLCYEHGYGVPPGATITDWQLLFDETCFESPEDAYNVSELPNPSNRVVVHEMCHMFLLDVKGEMGPYYKVENGKTGDLLANSIEEAVTAIHRSENGALLREYHHRKAKENVQVAGDVPKYTDAHAELLKSVGLLEEPEKEPTVLDNLLAKVSMLNSKLVNKLLKDEGLETYKGEGDITAYRAHAEKQLRDKYTD